MNERFPDSEPLSCLKKDLQHLAADLVPNDRYELALIGAHLTDRLEKSLSAAAGVTLSKEDGASIALDYNELDGDLHIKAIKVKLERIDGILSIIDMGDRGYVGLIDCGDKTPLRQSSPVIPLSAIEDIRAELRLTHPPIEHAEEYRLWLANVIDDCPGWRLIERMSLDDGTIGENGYVTYSTRIEREQEYLPDGASESICFSYNIDISDGEGGTTTHSRQLQLNDHITEDESFLTSIQKTTSTRPHPFAPKLSEVTRQSPRNIDLTAEEIQYFDTLLSSSQRMKDNLKDIPNN